MTVDEMKEKKRQLGYSSEKLAKLSGVPLGTVQKIFGGFTKAPRYKTLQSLEKVFVEAEQKEDLSTGAYVPGKQNVMMVHEPAAAYHTGGMKGQGGYTIEDYFSLPEEKRAELIDGVFYDMASTSVIHQLIAGQIFVQLNVFLRKKKASCVPCIAPVDVQLDCDDRTMVQPDVLVVCDREKIRKSGIFGAPDFVAEILSKTTRRKDMVVKLAKYAQAGVREYWLIDPDKQNVLVYDLKNMEFPSIYGFDAKIPVTIFGGECKINMRDIQEYMENVCGLG